MQGGLSTSGNELVHRLGQEEVLRLTVEQLRKDLNLPALLQPPTDDHAFGALHEQVLEKLTRWSASDPSALSRAINRADLTEKQVDAAMNNGGLSGLASGLVLRCLQKVLLRKRFSASS